MSIRVPRFSASAALAIGGGIGVALSLPPWGFWPLAFIGIAMFEMSLGEKPSRSRPCRARLAVRRSVAVSRPGVDVVADRARVPRSRRRSSPDSTPSPATVSPTGPWRVIGRPAAHTLAEALRLVFPFGGVPLATLPIGQADGPLAGVVRFGGVILLTWVVFQIGFALAGPSPVRSTNGSQSRPT